MPISYGLKLSLQLVKFQNSLGNLQRMNTHDNEYSIQAGLDKISPSPLCPNVSSLV